MKTEETTGQRSKKIREYFAESQKDFGKKIGLTKSAVSAVENDKAFMSAKVLSTLFFDLNVNLNYLICGDGDMFNKKAAQFEDAKADILLQVRQMLKEEGLIS